MNMSRKLVPIQEAADALGVSAQTLRRWEREGRLIPDERTAGGRRRYDLGRLKPELFHADTGSQRKTVAYARVSSHDQMADLERQKQVLEVFCARQGWTFEVIADLGSGMNYQKKGLKRLLEAIIEGEIGRLVITHKDRLCNAHTSTNRTLSSGIRRLIQATRNTPRFGRVQPTWRTLTKDPDESWVPATRRPSGP